MKEYPKIQSLFKRDEKTHKFIIGQFSLPEFAYLQDNIWYWTEKIDGTNIRIDWGTGETDTGIPILSFGGRTDHAQMPPRLSARLHEIFTVDKFKSLYPETPMTLYGEGYGAGIQKGGGNYIPDSCDFILFDVMIDGWWLKQEDITDIALKLGIEEVPLVAYGSIEEAIDLVSSGITSHFGNFQAEGIVLKPVIELRSRAGHRIITKMKTKDF